jgi:hypothetical protein
MIKDFYCIDCETIRRDEWVENANVSAGDFRCVTCGHETLHIAMCNGGTGNRYRYVDFSTDPRDYRGQCEITYGAKSSIDNKDLTYHNGSGKIANVINNTDRRSERMDRIYHDTDRKRGTLPIVFDGKRTK